MRTLLILLLLALTFKALPQVVKAEYFFDNGAVAYGQGISLTVPLNTGDVQITADLPVNSLSPGFHQVFFRVKDANKGWSPLTPKSFMKPYSHGVITKLKYCIDAISGSETWIYRAFPTPSSDVSIDLDVPLGTLSKGIHFFEAMARSESGVWSGISKGTFFNLYTEPVNITKLEYYFESENGVAGSLYSVNNFTHSPNVTLDSVTFSVPVSLLIDKDKYFVYFRAVDEVGNRSFYMKDTIVYHTVTTGIKDQINLTSGLLIFPNPVSGMVNFKFVPLEHQGNLIIRVFNVTGKTVIEKEFSLSEADHYTIDASNLISGVYRIVISTTSGKPAARATFIKN